MLIFERRISRKRLYEGHKYGKQGVTAYSICRDSLAELRSLHHPDAMTPRWLIHDWNSTGKEHCNVCAGHSCVRQMGFEGHRWWIIWFQAAIQLHAQRIHEAAPACWLAIPCNNLLEWFGGHASKALPWWFTLQVSRATHHVNLLGEVNATAREFAQAYSPLLDIVPKFMCQERFIACKRILSSIAILKSNVSMYEIFNVFDCQGEDLKIVL